MFEIKWIFYGLRGMLQFSEFIWALSYSVWEVCNNFLFIDATDRSKISGDQKRFFITLSLYPLSFFTNTPFNEKSANFEFYNNKEKKAVHSKQRLNALSVSRSALVIYFWKTINVYIKILTITLGKAIIDPPPSPWM